MKNADLELVDSTGARWTATVLTLNEIDQLMTSYEATGECMSGAFFACPDLLIVRKPTIPAVVAVIEGLLRSGDYRHELRRLAPDSEDVD